MPHYTQIFIQIKYLHNYFNIQFMNTLQIPALNVKVIQSTNLQTFTKITRKKLLSLNHIFSPLQNKLHTHPT